MISLSYEKGTNDLIVLNRNGVISKMDFIECSKVLSAMRLNTVVVVKNTKKDVPKHRGTYLLLFMEEYEECILFYVSITGELIQVCTKNIKNIGAELYKYVADGTPIRILKSDNKQAYRVVSVSPLDEEVVITETYKNKSSKVIKRTYMGIFDALRYCSYLRKRDNRAGFRYRVITPKNVVLLEV